MSIRYVVRTLDRPDDVRDLLAYMARFTPDLGLVIIDGSELDAQAQNKAEIARYADRLNVELVSIPPKVNVPERTIAGLEAISDEFVFFGADDDLPCMEFIDEANRLIASGAVSRNDKIFGDQVKMSVLSKDYMNIKKLSVPPAGSDDPMIRLRRLSQHYQPLVYGVFGREALIEEYRMTQDVLMTGPDEYDFSLGERFMGAIAVARGRLHYVPGMAMIRCIKSFRHETVDTGERMPPLFTPRIGERAWQAVRHIARETFGEFDTLDAERQRALIVEVNDLVLGRRGRPDMSTNPRWKKGDAFLRRVFDGVSPEYRQYRERLNFARDCILAAATALYEGLQATPDGSVILPSPKDVEATLAKLKKINASDWRMVLHADSMTTLDLDEAPQH